MEDEKFSNCSPFWLWSLRFDLDDKKNIREDIELVMEYFCHQWAKNEKVPKEFFQLLNQIFQSYLSRKQFYGALESAFGFTGKQGERNNEKRDEDLATDIVRLYLAGKSITNAKIIVMRESKLGKTTIEDAWRKHKVFAIVRVRIELRYEGKEFTEKQIKLAEKLVKKSNEIFHSLYRKPDK